MYEPRFYRNEMGNDLAKSFTIKHYETDLWIEVEKDAYCDAMKQFVHQKVIELRWQLEKYILSDAIFAVGLTPHPITKSAPPIARLMAYSAEKANVGPMAAVAGAFSQMVGEAVEEAFNINKIIVENGGDIYIRSTHDMVTSIYAGKSPLSGKLKIQVSKEHSPLGICTSSGTVGHSLSFGRADAVTVICKNAALADAYATALCNQVQEPKDIERVLGMVSKIEDIIGVMIIYQNRVGILGDIRIGKQ